MPLLGKRGDYLVGAIQADAGRDAYIEFLVEETPVEEVRREKLPPINNSHKAEVDPDEIEAAVSRAVDDINGDFGQNLQLQSIRYIPNDSQHYDLHHRAAYLVMREHVNGVELKDLENDPSAS